MDIYRLTIFLALLGLTGCVPFPHTSERFPAMQGRVVDAATDQPISGALVTVHDHPSTESKTDASGSFHFSKHRNYHLGVTFGICSPSWPEGSAWSDLLNISHPA